jgi:sortase A
MIKRLGLVVPIALIGVGLWFFIGNLTPFFASNDTKKVNQVEAPVQEDTVNAPKRRDSQDQVLYPVRPQIGEEMGELYIPKLDATLPIFHGTDEDELEKGVGHYAGSVLPGEKDNSVLSGHRDTVFRRLGEVGEGNLLVVRTTAGEFIYKVRQVRIVDADDRTVIVPMPKATLTVTTCYPFQFIGDAPERYILVADLIKENKKG